MGWLIDYGIGAAVVLFICGAAIGRGASLSLLQVTIFACLWPIVLPMVLGGLADGWRIMASPSDYLNLSELRELAEIDADLAGHRSARKDLNTRKAKIKARAVKRRDDAELRLRREMEAVECRRVIS